jgi:regulator of sigma E protease
MGQARSLTCGQTGEITLLITIIAFVLVFAGIIMVHELGHFFAAKLSGVKVDEFGLGYPPRIWGVKRGETLYSINALPLGGFTKMSGEEDPTAPRSLASKSRLTRIFILSAGALLNALLPFLLFSIAYMVPHEVATGQITVQEVAANSPAYQAGLQPGDIFLSINGQPLSDISDLSRYTQLNLGKEIQIQVRTATGEERSLVITPRWKPPTGEGAMGVSIKLENISVNRKSEPLWRAVPLGVKETFQTFVLFKNAILSLFVGTTQIQMTGPVGIAQLTGEAAQAGFSILLEFAAFLSLNLAVINLLPLPALDGGRIAFVVLEWLRRGKRISPHTEGVIHTIGFLLLIGLALAVTYQDIVRIIQGGSVIP